MKYSYKKILFLLIILLSVFLISSQTLAFSGKFWDYLGQTAGPSGANYSSAQASESFINTKIGQIVGGIVGLIGIIFLGLTVYSGLQWMTAGGNEETVTKSKKRVINGTIGVGVTLCAFLLANLYFSFFEQKFLNPGAPTNVNVAPYGFQNAACQTDAQCADRTGPTTGDVMFCAPNSICAECDQNGPEIGPPAPHQCPAGYNCDLQYGLCAPNPNLTCAQLTPAGPGQCIFDPNCVWMPDPSQEEWNVGQCINNSDSPCFDINQEQCTENQPFCCSDSQYCAGSYLNHCVECISEDGGYNNCESGGTGLNFCQDNHTCTF